MDYSSDVERLYCEASELLQHKHYAAAHAKMGEYQALNGGVFSRRDSKFFLKIELGNLRVNLTEQNLNNCASLWQMVAGGDISDEYDEMKENAYFVTNRSLSKYVFVAAGVCVAK